MPAASHCVEKSQATAAGWWYAPCGSHTHGWCGFEALRAIQDHLECGLRLDACPCLSQTLSPLATRPVRRLRVTLTPPPAGPGCDVPAFDTRRRCRPRRYRPGPSAAQLGLTLAHVARAGQQS